MGFIMSSINFITKSKYFSDNIKNWITPSYPDWYKTLKTSKDLHTDDGTTARGCPAFVHLFKNSYLLRAPMDISFVFYSDGTYGFSNAQMASGVADHLNFVKIGSFNLTAKMGTEFSRVSNLKLDLAAKIIPDVATRCIFLDPQYHVEAKLPFTIMTGILPMYPELFSTFALNVMINNENIKYDEWFHIKEGTPLSYMYFPEGKPKIKSEWVSEEDFWQVSYQRTQFNSDFLKKESKRDDSLILGVPWTDE